MSQRLASPSLLGDENSLPMFCGKSLKATGIGNACPGLRFKDSAMKKINFFAFATVTLATLLASLLSVHPAQAVTVRTWLNVGTTWSVATNWMRLACRWDDRPIRYQWHL